MIGYDSIRAGSNALDAESMCESFCLIRMWGRFCAFERKCIIFSGRDICLYKLSHMPCMEDVKELIVSFFVL